MRRICCILGLCFCALMLISLPACSKASEPAASRSRPDLPIWQLSFRDIPGISAEEILAIEELQRQGFTYTVSVPYSTELFIDENGEASGYTALLCQWLSELFELSFEPKIEPLGLIAQTLSAGESAFALQVITEERQLNFFLSDPIAMRSIRIMRLKDSQSISAITQSRMPRYVFLEGAMAIGLFAGTPEPGLIADDYEAVYRILLNAEADAFVGNSTMEVAFDSFGGVVTEDFFPLTFIPVTLATGNQNLKPIISVVTKALQSGAYSHLTELYRQGYQEYRRQRFLMLLTEEEREYIRDNPVIPFATQYQSYPISFFNRHENRWEGAVFDVLDEMEHLTGLGFHLVNGPDAELTELMNLLENGTAYFIPNLVQSDERRERFIWPNTMYISDRYALLSKRSFPNIELNDIPFARVGLHRGSAFTDMFRSWFPNAVNAVEYPSSALSFMALDRGEVDLVMSTQSRLATMTNLYELSDYKANFLFNAAFEASFGINRDMPILASIVDKALILIDTERIMEQWQSITYDYQARLMREQRPWLFGISILAICVLALVSVLLKISRSTGKKLETLVRERTNELEQRTNEARAASQSKTSFLANMSHEMRTPMNVVVGLTGLMLEEDDPSLNLKENLKKISTAGNTLLGLINDVLDISKIEAGRLELMPVKYEIPSLLNDIITLNMIRIEDKPIKFKLDINEDLPCNLYGDDLRVKQIINNLLGNAFKYTQQGTVTLGISCSQRGDDVFVSVYVRDTGIGIREEDLKKLFTDYGQVDTRTNRMIEGTGLGLSITKRLTELMDGEISAESEYGKGSVFRVRFRQGFVDNTEIGSTVTENLRKFRHADDKQNNSGKLERLDLSFARVLVVDDMQTNLDVASGLLGKYKIHVDCLLSGPEAIQRIRDGGTNGHPLYNAIFMDHMMPGMDGIETTDAIRSLDSEYAKKIPVIALTANAIHGMEELFLSHGFQAFLPKPIDIRILDSLVRKWVKKE
ncbi:MAG: ATP-binding protein [Treponema sp.]|nr:ATP-binding protein [Treponema sp.]